MSEHKSRTLPQQRLSRLAHLGSLAGRVAGAAAWEGARRLSKGEFPSTQHILMTPANAVRLAETLATMRGAAMKLGQLLSLDAGEFLPTPLAQALEGLRADAYHMPMLALNQVLEREWGEDWQRHFRRFHFTPIASASIGQVHRSTLTDGREVAVKVQYPGVRQSIESDVKNLGTLIRLSGAVPKGVAIAPLLEELKLQLRQEADYQQELGFLTEYHHWLSEETALSAPTPVAELSTTDVLVMEYIDAMPVDMACHWSQPRRDALGASLLRLCLRELFELGIVQTDPNYANYLIRETAQGDELVLLDFGAARRYGDNLKTAYRQLFSAVIAQDPQALMSAAQGIGYFAGEVEGSQKAAVLALFSLACEPLTTPGAYDFGQSTLASRLQQKGRILSMQQGRWHTPPADALFLHRRLAGLYLLLGKLRARVDAGAILAEVLANLPQNTAKALPVAVKNQDVAGIGTETEFPTG
ncbi:ABC1 kinase family protein [Pokkaliibacter sp. CJK22405]|uniref:ABC1 kinase family protein n=1 Tax=Pokkaliibacter sp. CJK22405 TaxID=3384615 RepID=UPI003984C50D